MSRSTIGRRRFQLFDALLNQFPPGRLLDLGAGHGKFSIRAADAGWRVTAVDARDERFVDDNRITWVQQDVREFDVSDHDLILNLGLFYHLTVEDQVALLERAAGTPMILDTHVAAKSSTHKLGPPVTAGGYQGRMYREGDIATSSWQNETSFWPTEGELYRMLAEHGYPVVLAGVPWVTGDRTFFL